MTTVRAATPSAEAALDAAATKTGVLDRTVNALDAAYAAALHKVDPGDDAGGLREELVLIKGCEKALSEVPTPAL